MTSKAINWGENSYFGEGRAPAVAITDSGSVVVVYENAYGCYKSYYRVGTLNTEHKRIKWVKEAQLYGYGQELSVAMKDDGTVIEVHMQVCTSTHRWKTKSELSRQHFRKH